jgi:hypothetical protein
MACYSVAYRSTRKADDYEHERVGDFSAASLHHNRHAGRCLMFGVDMARRASGDRGRSECCGRRLRGFYFAVPALPPVVARRLGTNDRHRAPHGGRRGRIHPAVLLCHAHRRRRRLGVGSVLRRSLV